MYHNSPIHGLHARERELKAMNCIQVQLSQPWVVWFIMKTNLGHIKWDTERILRESRVRTAALMTDNTKRVQEMLEDLMEEAGWTESEFIDALCTDVITRRRPSSSRKIG